MTTAVGVFGASALLVLKLITLNSAPPLGITWWTFRSTKTVNVAPVKVLVCIEALCPDCQRFVLNDLIPTYGALGKQVLDLTLVPFGNAEIDKHKKTVECQHGVGECDSNSYEQCSLAVYSDPTIYLPLIGCLYETLPMGRHNSTLPARMFESCFQKSNLHFDAVKACHDSPEVAWELMERAERATPSSHDHVPWIEINGVYMDEAKENFVAQVCKAYIAAGGSDPKCKNGRVGAGKGVPVISG